MSVDAGTVFGFPQSRNLINSGDFMLCVGHCHRGAYCPQRSENGRLSSLNPRRYPKSILEGITVS